MATPKYFTADMVRALPDDGTRYETVFGELLVSPSPAPRHQIVLMRLVGELLPYLKASGVGTLLSSPADISFGRDDVLVQPDLFVFDTGGERFTKWTQITRLLLAIEVLSPSSIRQDRFTKRRLYQTLGADEYWVIDHEGGFIEVWTADAVFPLVAEDSLMWNPKGAPSPLSLDVRALLTM